MAAGSKSKDMVLLWTNSSPTSAYGASGKTETLDLSGYDFVYVIARYATSDDRTTSALVPINGCKALLLIVTALNNSTAYINARRFTATSTGVEFEAACHRSMTSTTGASDTGSYVIPTAIYGVRG